jgi:hypothetical protein
VYAFGLGKGGGVARLTTRSFFYSGARGCRAYAHHYLEYERLYQLVQEQQAKIAALEVQFTVSQK